MCLTRRPVDDYIMLLFPASTNTRLSSPNVYLRENFWVAGASVAAPWAVASQALSKNRSVDEEVPPRLHEKTSLPQMLLTHLSPKLSDSPQDRHQCFPGRTIGRQIARYAEDKTHCHLRVALKGPDASTTERPLSVELPRCRECQSGPVGFRPEDRCRHGSRSSRGHWRDIGSNWTPHSRSPLYRGDAAAPAPPSRTIHLHTALTHIGKFINVVLCWRSRKLQALDVLRPQKHSKPTPTNPRDVAPRA